MNKRSGQSLVEVMLALAVLTTGFLGILTLLAQSFHISKTISNESTATYLAAEGIEMMKSLIDHDVYEHLAGLGTGWGTCFGLSAGQHADYELDYTRTACAPQAYSASDFLYYSPTTHLYSYSGTVVTPFTRRIRVTINSDPTLPEITVQSIVSWSTGPLTSQSVNLEDDFYNWHP